ncbi:sporulation integral membrane protein YtvI [Bacillus sp. HMF5848]|uniref:sporulation integral membrane protein YtvI n=1 Tax=Bacillus sp. HMF5848 TaxID=2495421 RepID=UPI0021AD784A|nr:sporulation integral membrane protein YtvI [Bacillus sp. HMF5848]
MTSQLLKKITLYVFIISIALLFFFWIVPISIPLIVALITAFFLEPLVRLFQGKLKLKRQLAVLITFILFVLCFGIASYFIVTKVITEAVQIVENAPTYINDINRAWENAEVNLQLAFKDLPPDIVNEVSKQVDNFLLKTKDSITNSVNIDNLKRFITNIPDYLINFLVFLISLFLFMLEIPRLKEALYSHLTEKTADRVTFMTSRLSYVVFGFIKAQFLVSLVIFIASLLGLLWIQPKVAFLMAIIIWIIDVIPIIGSIIVMAPWSLFHFFTGNTALGVKLAILAVILLIIRRTIEPKVMGSHIGLSPLSTLIAMFLGLNVFGVLGFFIGPLILIGFNSAREAGIIKFKFKI